ncbi:hypothetical protein CONPUDRAFT_69131 [Coniophora puteana RWD-64-598 SS2]|uniref:Uncharacterized protein n=1 Tax=Coniophora puteana (strain RWD-64-598) TaxID=741705 RepID=A0A5M3N5U4_CONPW|nr:uncharacterized protein CONPUDRAFT_69131 [Coniophora puteana RWD-64-598 SS2]EIW86688.1 hypothetical protein CONPUDRAFT_69131 [Coniophora puteana RWD-64-598 SS2]
MHGYWSMSPTHAYCTPNTRARGEFPPPPCLLSVSRGYVLQEEKKPRAPVCSKRTPARTSSAINDAPALKRASFEAERVRRPFWTSSAWSPAGGIQQQPPLSLFTYHTAPPTSALAQDEPCAISEARVTDCASQHQPHIHVIGAPTSETPISLLLMFPIHVFSERSVLNIYHTYYPLTTTADDGTVVLAHWPSDTKPYIERLYPNINCPWLGTDVATARSVVPTDMDDFASWATIQDNVNASDRYRRKWLLYSAKISNDLGSDMAARRVTLKIHGFIKSLNISTFGDWKGQPGSVNTASHFLILNSGSHRDVWGMTTDPLNNIAQYATRVLRHPFNSTFPIFGRQLLFQHRVFDKINDTTVDDHSTAYTNFGELDDPFSLLPKIPPGWRLAPQVHVRAAGPGGKISDLPSPVLSPGDFVEVLAQIDLVLAPNNRGRLTLKTSQSYRTLPQPYPNELYRLLHHMPERATAMKGSGFPPISYTETVKG